MELFRLWCSVADEAVPRIGLTVIIGVRPSRTQFAPRRLPWSIKVARNAVGGPSVGSAQGSSYEEAWLLPDRVPGDRPVWLHALHYLYVGAVRSHRE